MNTAISGKAAGLRRVEMSIKVDLEPMYLFDKTQVPMPTVLIITRTQCCGYLPEPV